jgi:hypothetical protein
LTSINILIHSLTENFGRKLLREDLKVIAEINRINEIVDQPASPSQRPLLAKAEVLPILKDPSIAQASIEHQIFFQEFQPLPLFDGP